ncbi:hypothetical protein [Streptomyces sp.]|uniref:hypothetical protein n=1 Tax=Streptomyces sp. TaxID=1931 RepID=UPI002F41861F
MLRLTAANKGIWKMAFDSGRVSFIGAWFGGGAVSFACGTVDFRDAHGVPPFALVSSDRQPLPTGLPYVPGLVAPGVTSGGPA